MSKPMAELPPIDVEDYDPDEIFDILQDYADHGVHSDLTAAWSDRLVGYGHMEDDEQQLSMELPDVSNETKQGKFLRLVNKRLPEAVRRIRLLANLTSPAYDYTDEQADAVIATLRVELEELEKAYRRQTDERTIPVIK